MSKLCLSKTSKKNNSKNYIMKPYKPKFNESGSILKFNVNKILKDNFKLRNELVDAVTKQHQEMSRAIKLSAKNTKLKKLIQKAEVKACVLKR